MRYLALLLWLWTSVLVKSFHKAKDEAKGELAAEISAASETFTLKAGHTLSEASFPYWVTCGSEKILVESSPKANEFKGKRAQLGTAAAIHGEKAAVELLNEAEHITELQEAVNALEEAHLVPTAKSAAYEAVSGDLVEMEGEHTVTLPTPTANRIVAVVSTNGKGSAPCTVKASSGEIKGRGVKAAATSILLGAAGAFAVFIADGTNWYIVAGEQDSGWIEITVFENSAKAGGVKPFYRLRGNMVTLRGEVKEGTAGKAWFTLPSGYRIAAGGQVVCGRSAGGTFTAMVVSVNTTGAIEPAVAEPTALYLAGASFLVD